MVVPVLPEVTAHGGQIFKERFSWCCGTREGLGETSETVLFELDFEECVGGFCAEKAVPVNTHCLLFMDSAWPRSLGTLRVFFKCWGQQAQAKGAVVSS